MIQSSLAPATNKRSAFPGEWLLLILLMVVLSAVNIPAQWTTISTDPDFAAWGSSIANRMGPHSRLYDFGGHIPVPPLSFVFLYVVSGGHATWLTESIWNQLAIMATVVVMTGIMLTAFKRSVAFLAAIATLGMFSKWATVLLYCSLTNLLATCLAAVVLAYMRRSSSATARYLLMAAGVLASMVLLSKQSIAVLMLPATAAAIFIFPKSATLKSRMFSTGVFVVSALVASGILCWLMSPLVNISGMITDVFLTGTECKGGVGEILHKLAAFSCDIGSSVVFGILALGTACGARQVAINQDRHAPASVERQNFSIGWLISVLAGGLLVAVLTARAQFFLLPNIYFTLAIGLVASVFAALAIIFQKWLQKVLPGSCFDEECFLLGLLTAILLPAAVGYCLSEFIGEQTLFWFVNSIPFVQVALTAMVYFALEGVAVLPRSASRVTGTIFGIVIICMTWQPCRVHWLELKYCTDVWPRVAWFQGARVTTRARPLQTLVAEVRTLAKPGETVLFLPDDPNVEECFDRPRPALNCPVVFSDFYWTRYVNDDFAILQKNPPKVVILGPRDNWLKINDEHNDSGAAKALVQRVRVELLPGHYRLADAHQINYGYGVDYLDVWVRTD